MNQLKDEARDVLSEYSRIRKEYNSLDKKNPDHSERRMELKSRYRELDKEYTELLRRAEESEDEDASVLAEMPLDVLPPGQRRALLAQSNAEQPAVASEPAPEEVLEPPPEEPDPIAYESPPDPSSPRDRDQAKGFVAWQGVLDELSEEQTDEEVDWTDIQTPVEADTLSEQSDALRASTILDAFEVPAFEEIGEPGEEDGESAAPVLDETVESPEAVEELPAPDEFEVPVLEEMVESPEAVEELPAPDEFEVPVLEEMVEATEAVEELPAPDEFEVPVVEETAEVAEELEELRALGEIETRALKEMLEVPEEAEELPAPDEFEAADLEETVEVPEEVEDVGALGEIELPTLDETVEAPGEVEEILDLGEIEEPALEVSVEVTEVDEDAPGPGEFDVAPLEEAIKAGEAETAGLRESELPEFEKMSELTEEEASAIFGEVEAPALEDVGAPDPQTEDKAGSSGGLFEVLSPAPFDTEENLSGEDPLKPVDWADEAVTATTEKTLPAVEPVTPPEPPSLEKAFPVFDTATPLMAEVVTPEETGSAGEVGATCPICGRELPAGTDDCVACQALVEGAREAEAEALGAGLVMPATGGADAIRSSGTAKVFALAGWVIIGLGAALAGSFSSGVGRDTVVQFFDTLNLGVVVELQYGLIVSAAMMSLGAAVLGVSVASKRYLRIVMTLHELARGGKVEALEGALDQGEDIEERDHQGCTPLHFAVAAGRIDSAVALLNRGADIEAKNDAGDTPLHMAVAGQNLEMVLSLIEHGATIHKVNRDGLSMMHIAAWVGDVELLTAFCERGLNMELRTRAGLTPLHLAAQSGNADIVEQLIARGVDADAGNSAGATPLCSAARNGHLDVVEHLLDAGASPNVRESFDYASPLSLAQENKQKSVASLLRARGAAR